MSEKPENWTMYVPLPPTAYEQAQSYTCRICGAVVFEQGLHADWHRRMLRDD